MPKFHLNLNPGETEASDTWEIFDDEGDVVAGFESPHYGTPSEVNELAERECARLNSEADPESQQGRICHYCRECGAEVDESCPDHPKAIVDSAVERIGC